jgi:cell division protein FtsQ
LAIILVGVPVVLGWWVASSPIFRLSEVQIGGTTRVTTEEVIAALAPLRGRHLLGLSLVDVEGRLSRNPWIEGATIRKELPDRVVVEVHEREPAALLRQDGDLFYVDAGGFVIVPYDPSGPVDLLLLSAVPGAPLNVESALQVAAALGRGVPEWGAGLSEIEILGFEDFRLHTANLPYPLLVSADRVEEQVRKLREILPQIESRYAGVTAIDLRFSRQIVFQPAVKPRSQEG